MEPLFINRYVRDETVFRELHFYYRYRRPLMLIIHILLAVDFLYSVIATVFFFPLWEPIVIVLLGEILIYVMYRIQLSSAVKRDRETFGGQPEVTVEVTETGIRGSANGQFSAEVPFDQFRRATETKHLIVLTSKARLLYIFHKDSFQQGTVAELRRFLWERKIYVK